MRLLRLAVVVLALTTLSLTSRATAQTTSQIVGTILDAQNRVISGATVTVTGPGLQGVRTTMTSTDGSYRLPALPPGTYTVTAQMPGFQTARQENVALALGQTSTVGLALNVAGVTSEVNVVAQTPVVDVTSSSGGITADADLFDNLPMRRGFYAISRLAPGVNEDGVGATAHGSSGAENQYLVEGLNMTGILAGERKKTIHFDFIQEVNVRTEGMNAEYGRMTGTVIEAITKSGGNVFHGGLFAYGTGNGFTANNATAARLPGTYTEIVDVNRDTDAGFHVGGFLVKDRLWFFGAYDRVTRRADRTIIRTLQDAEPGTPEQGAVVPQHASRHIFAGKLTAKPGTNQSLVLSINGDPGRRKGAIFPVAGPATTWEGTIDEGGIDGIVRYDGLFGGTWMLHTMYGRHNENTVYGGAGTTTPLVIDATVSPQVLSGGLGSFQDTDLGRDHLKADVAHFHGRHTLKAGFDFERVKGVSRSTYSGGQAIRKFNQAGVDFYEHAFYVDDRAPGFDREDPHTWVIANPFVAEPLSRNTAFYAQDSFRAARNVTVDAGLRWERQDISGRDRSTAAISLRDNWAARLGVVVDPIRDGRTKVFGHYGRYFESIPLDINIRAFGGELSCFCYNFSPNPASIAQDDNAPLDAALFGGLEPVDSPLKGQFVDEYLVGVEREVRPSLVVAVRFNYRRLGRVIEDFLTESGEYFIANPGEGHLGQSLTFYDMTQVPSPRAARVNKSLELSARRRLSNNWQFIGSYTWARLTGNYDGTYQSSTDQLDPNGNSAFDFADFLINADGPLTNDRRHQLKLDGSYHFSTGRANGLTLGTSTRYLSGTPQSAYGYSFSYGNWEYYLTPRGALGRGPADYEADFHVGYPIRLRNSRSLNLSMDIFNVFNRQAATVLDQRYNLQSDDLCAGIPSSACNGDGGLMHRPGSLTPVGQLADPITNAPNPDFLRAGLAFTAPRAIRFGARFTF